jgi:drug/metabolite transporter (DMT)-like permease
MGVGAATTSPETAVRHTRAALLLNFAIVYVVWGSTYLAIKYAIVTLPPFLMAALRFLIAGGALYAWSRMRGAPRPTFRQWRNALLVGTLLLACGNGAVVWAEQRVASGATAVLVATVSLWMVLVPWMRPGGKRPRISELAGVVMGLAGVALLAAPHEDGTSASSLFGVLVLVCGSLAWAIGSFVSREVDISNSAPQASGMQMLCGGVTLAIAALVSGDVQRFDPGSVSLTSALALLYLVVFGSVIAFSSYMWLLGATTPAKAGTYAYVNPVVAVLLGVLIAGEPLTMREVMAMIVILGAVGVVAWARTMGSKPAMAAQRASIER